jgi:hypothetical protein
MTRRITGTLDFLFNSEFEFLTIMTQIVLLQGNKTRQAPVMSWGGSPGVGQPSTLLSLPLAGFYLSG